MTTDTTSPQAGEPRLIANTSEPMRHPWPADVFVQGGALGVVVRGGEVYRTAFVEAFPGTFLRGEGATIAEAEDAAWRQYEVLASCDPHGPYEARQYRNGAGYCVKCGTWFSKVLPEQPEDPDREPSMLERALTGDNGAAATALALVANADSLPELPAAERRS